MRKIIPDIVSDQDILEFAGDASVRDAVRRMAARNVNSAVISDGERIAGIFTGTDLIGKVVAMGLDPDATALSQVMTPNPETVGPHDNAIEALHRMHDGGFRHLPVVDNHKLVGVVSRRDFLGYEVEEVERQDQLWEEL